MPTYEYKCSCCGHEFEAIRPISECGETEECPACQHEPCHREFRTAPAVKWFPGSQTFDSRVEAQDRMAKEAQAEGFRSQTEMEEAHAQAEDRAKRLGIPVSRILGGTKANFEGELKISEADKRKQKNLYQNYMEKGLLGKDLKGAAKAKQDLQRFESAMQKKHKGERKYKPTLSKETAKSMARAQQKNFTNQV